MSGCYLNKCMIVNNYLCFDHKMFELNLPKHNLMFNFKLDIMLQMLIYINDIPSFSLKGGVLSEEGCSVTANVTPYASLVRTE
jgi:hypothetical protein